MTQAFMLALSIILLGNLNLLSVAQAPSATNEEQARPESDDSSSPRRRELERLGALGKTHYEAGDFGKALNEFKRALAIAREIRDRVYEGVMLSNVGFSYSGLGKAEMAIEHFDQALSIARELGDRDEEGTILLNLGRSYDGLRGYDKAIGFYKEALEIARESGSADGAVIALQLGFAHRNLSQSENAISSFEQALEIARAAKDRDSEWTALSILGLTNRDLNEHQKAIGYFEQALVIAQATDDRDREAGTLNSLAAENLNLSGYRDAIRYSEKALAVARAISDRAYEATALNILSSSYEGLSQFNQAIAYAEQALGIARDITNRPTEARALNNLGNSYHGLSEYNTSIEYKQQALAVSREIGDRGFEENVLNGLGVTHYALSEYDKAIGYFERALAMSPDGTTSVETRINLGHTYVGLSEYKRAIDYYDQALPIVRKMGLRESEEAVLNNLGEVYSKLGRNDESIAYFEQALSIAREIGDRDGEGSVLANLAATFDTLNQPEKALRYYEQALAIHKDVGNRYAEGMILNNLGVVHKSSGDYEKATRYFEQALAIARAIGNREGERTGLSNLGSVHGESNQFRKAIDEYERALAIGREIGNRQGEATTLGNLMRFHSHLKQPRVAIFYGKQAINVYQSIRKDLTGLTNELQRSFVSSQEETYRILADVLIDEGRIPEGQAVLALLKQEEFFDFTRRNGTRTSSADGRAELTPAEAEWEKRYRELADRLTTIGLEYERLVKFRSRSAEQEAQRNLLWSQLTVANEAFRRFLRSLETEAVKTPDLKARLAEVKDNRGLQSVLRFLGEGSVAIQTLVTDNRLWIVVITPSVTKAVEVRMTKTELNRKIAAFRSAVEDRRETRTLGKELFEVLIAPIENDLLGAEARTLMWSLDGALRYVPIAALYDGENYLVERYRNVIFTPASNANLKDEPQTKWTALGLGVSEAAGPFGALPGARAELESIIRRSDEAPEGGVLNGVVHLDGEFTAEVMQRELEQHRPVVHIASHFNFVPGDETQSFLLLGNGAQLTLADLDTWPTPFEGVDLLTLSACNTASGGEANGKEVEGFAVLSQRQGAKAVMATLWPVADASTNTLMQAFYRFRATPPTTKAEALRQAQLALLREGAAGNSTDDRGMNVPSGIQTAPAGYSHPYYWAGFLLIGNWR